MENGKKKKKTIFDSPKLHWKFTRNTSMQLDIKRKEKINKRHDEIFNGDGRANEDISLTKGNFLLGFF